MKLLHTVAVPVAAALLVGIMMPGCAARVIHKIASSGDKTDAKLTPEQALRAANMQFYAALNQMLAGNADQVAKSWSHTADISNFGPFGGKQVGWKDVSEQFKKEAAMKMGGTVVCENPLVSVSEEMGYATCTEVCNGVSLDGKVTKVEFRSTNIFRLESGDWKLVHHHTDPSTPMENAASKGK